jgi:hypothetical protein
VEKSDDHSIPVALHPGLPYGRVLTELERRRHMGSSHMRTLLFAFIASLSVVGDAYAGTILFSDFGPGNSYQAANAYGVEGAGVLGFLVKQAVPFTPVGNWTLTQIDLALAHTAGTNSVVVTLNADSGGIPGGILSTIGTLSGLPPFGSCCAVETLTPDFPVTSGVHYWIVVSPGASDTVNEWNINNTGVNTLSLETNNLGGWSANGAGLAAFDIQGAPEPETLLMFSLGVLAFGGLRVLKVRR